MKRFYVFLAAEYMCNYYLHCAVVRSARMKMTIEICSTNLCIIDHSEFIKELNISINIFMILRMLVTLLYLIWKCVYSQFCSQFVLRGLRFNVRISFTIVTYILPFLWQTIIDHRLHKRNSLTISGVRARDTNILYRFVKFFSAK